MVSEPCPNLAMSIESSIAHDLNISKQITEAEEQLEGRELFNRGAFKYLCFIIIIIIIIIICTQPYVQIT